MEKINKYGYCKTCRKLLPIPFLVPITIVENRIQNMINNQFVNFNIYEGGFLCKNCKEEIDKS